jgi:hypothetical protein
MNDTQEPARPTFPSMPPRMTHREFDTIGDAVVKEQHDKTRREQRSWRRAAAMNAVQMARVHAGKSDNDAYSGEESDIVVAIMDLLDKVAGA